MHCPKYSRLLNIKVIVVFGVLSLLITFLTVRFAADPNSGRDRNFPGHLSAHGRDVVEMHRKAVQQTHSECRNVPEMDTRPLLSVPRVAKYCNIPNSEPPGDEGMVSQDFKLLAAHVVIRHGDRAPLIRLPNEKAPSLSCLVDTSQFRHVPKLENYIHVMAQAAQGEGDSLTPDFNRWAMYPSHPECGEGQLTGQGAIQQMLNGLHLHQRYAQLPHNLSLDFTSVVAHTTVVSRTYQSALALLYSLLPEFQPKKLHLRSASTIMFCDSKAAPGSVCACPGLEALRNRAMAKCKSDPVVARSIASYQATAAKIVAQVLGVPVSKLPAPEAVMDALSRYACHSIPPPCSTSTTNSSCPTLVCIDASTMESLWAAVDAQSQCINNNSDYRKYAAVSTQGLLLRIVQSLHRVTLRKKKKRSVKATGTDSGSNANAPESEPVFALYSGHDNTLTPLITALGLGDCVWPGYATRLVFELYRRKSAPGGKAQHYIRILLNGQTVTSEAVFCRAGSTLSGSNEMCEFERFQSHVLNMKVQDFCSSLRSMTNTLNIRRKLAPKTKDVI